MPRDRDDQDYAGPLRRILVTMLVLVLAATFVVWRIDSPRVERLRASFIDRFVPTFDWAMLPVTHVMGMVEGFQSYARIYQQNQE